MIEPLTVDEKSVGRLISLPALHRDPFDRILACQALEHDLILVTADDLLRAYPIRSFTGD